MNKPELITRIAADHGCPKYEAKRIVEYFTESVAGILTEKESVNISGFGNFKIITAAEKTYRHPSTGQLETATSKQRIKFTPATRLAKSVE